jgi:hypothetical protein
MAAVEATGNRETMHLLAIYETALRRIENINNGPDRASGEWRCEEAAAIAREALKEKK